VRLRWLVSERSRFAGKTVLITGAGSGIGRAIALRFAQEGANLAIHDLNLEGAQETAKQGRELGRRVETYKVDVARPDEVRSAVAATMADFGRLNVLVNDAGINIVKRPFDYTDEDWESVLGVNLTGTWNYCRYAGPNIASGGGGSIVNIASVAATIASYYRVPYMASKGAVGMLTKALAMDLAEMRVRVNAVCPSAVGTPMIKAGVRRVGAMTREMVSALTPMRRFARASEVADAVLFLASDEASFVTGHLLLVDGGFSAGSQIGASWQPAPDDEELGWLT
jgi:NAD(P)-dependent dehydrogenase (short-subunit alcohol dehydrogenase family)